VGNTVRVLVQLVHPPRGHRTLPTRTGSMLILITIGVGTAAFNTGQNILYLALSMLLSTLLVSGLLSWWNFKGCRWRVDCGRHFRCGETSPVYLEVENTKRRLPSYALAFDLSAKRSGLRQLLALDGRLDPGAKTRLLWEFTPQKRGRETIALEGLVSRYPFGFLKKIIRDSFTRDITVWPGRIDYVFSADKAGRRWQYGQNRRRGEGVELVHLRGYRSGDPLKRIHWKASARMGSLQVRETEQEHHQAFSIRVDPSARIWREEARFETMCAFAGSLAEDLYQHDQLSSVTVLGTGSWPIGGIEDLYKLLDTLALLEWNQDAVAPGAGRVDASTVTFLPGPGKEVLARVEEQHVGQA
jgi:uncharacterized protein (DUF58 family)